MCVCVQLLIPLIVRVWIQVLIIVERAARCVCNLSCECLCFLLVSMLVSVCVCFVCAITSVTVHGLAARYPPYREFAGVIMLASV